MSKSKTAIEQTQARWRRSQSVRKKSLDNENRFIDVASSTSDKPFRGDRPCSDHVQDVGEQPAITQIQIEVALQKYCRCRDRKIIPATAISRCEIGMA
jgi:hypothetical protein